jgi:hypothetical protein
MKSSRTAAPIAAATLALVLGLTACGGSSDGGSSDGSSTPTTQPASEKTTRESPNASDVGALTPPGTKLKVGEEATVGWIPFSEENSGTGPHPGIDVKATVVAIEKGSADDLANVEIEGAEESSIPYYVKVRVEAITGTEPPPDEEPYIAFDAVDDRGQEQGSVTFFGEFEPCKEEDMPRPFTDGASYETCLTYLIPGGGSIEKVQWNDGPTKGDELTPYYDEPIVWE